MKNLQQPSVMTLTAPNQSAQPCATRLTLLQTAALALLALAILFSSRPAVADFLETNETVRSVKAKSNYTVENAALLEAFDFKFSQQKYRIRNVGMQPHSPASEPILTFNKPNIRAISTGYRNKKNTYVTVGFVNFFLNTNGSINRLSVSENNGSLSVSYKAKSSANGQRKSKNKSSYIKKDTVYPIFAVSLKF